MKKRVTFNLEASVYKDFQDFCEKNDVIEILSITDKLKQTYPTLTLK